MVLPGPASPYPGRKLGGGWSPEPEICPHSPLTGSLRWTSDSQGKALWNADVGDSPRYLPAPFSGIRTKQESSGCLFASDQVL